MCMQNGLHLTNNSFQSNLWFRFNYKGLDHSNTHTPAVTPWKPTDLWKIHRSNVLFFLSMGGTEDFGKATISNVQISQVLNVQVTIKKYLVCFKSLLYHLQCDNVSLFQLIGKKKEHSQWLPTIFIPTIVYSPTEKHIVASRSAWRTVGYNIYLDSYALPFEI